MPNRVKQFWKILSWKFGFMKIYIPLKKRLRKKWNGRLAINKGLKKAHPRKPTTNKCAMLCFAIQCLRWSNEVAFVFTLCTVVKRTINVFKQKWIKFTIENYERRVWKQRHEDMHDSRCSDFNFNFNDAVGCLLRFSFSIWHWHQNPDAILKWWK